ncbi:hypothetical protein ACFQH2_04915 [Natronoarchaeum sp. GCM10025703]|uniref:hypothetical protein n=1 Tax=Natronoarchaeum sp. GCM10025703 TaxID=3252685 RepID=UPI00362045FD
MARITDADGDEYEQLVDEVVFPERASIKTAVNALSGSDVRTFEDITGEMEVFDIRVASESPIAGQLLKDVDLPEGSLVISGAGETDPPPPKRDWRPANDTLSQPILTPQMPLFRRSEVSEFSIRSAGEL